MRPVSVGFLGLWVMMCSRILSKISGGSFTDTLGSGGSDYCGGCSSDFRRNGGIYDNVPIIAITVLGLRTGMTRLDRRRSSSLLQAPRSLRRNLWMSLQMTPLFSQTDHRDSLLVNRPGLNRYSKQLHVTPLALAWSQGAFDPTAALQYFSSPTKYLSTCLSIFACYRVDQHDRLGSSWVYDTSGVRTERGIVYCSPSFAYPVPRDRGSSMAVGIFEIFVHLFVRNGRMTRQMARNKFWRQSRHWLRSPRWPYVSSMSSVFYNLPRPHSGSFQEYPPRICLAKCS